MSKTLGILALVATFLLGVWIGKTVWGKTETVTRMKTEVRYEKGKEVRDTVYCPAPVKVRVRRDTVRVPVPTDTAALFAVWRDYYLEREYALDFGNDTIGEFKVDARVSENRLVSATSLVRPILRRVREEKVVYEQRKLVPWMSVGTSVDLKTNRVSAGVDVRGRYMFSATGIRLDDSYGYTVDFGVKF